MTHIVLASASPRRQELLRRIGIRDFDIVTPEADESCPAGLSPEETVQYISRKKAAAAIELTAQDDLVITADTMVFLDGERLGKPRDEDGALRMLRALSGRKHRVCTGVTLHQNVRETCFAVSTDVFFRRASDDELRCYIRGGEPMDKAGAYGVQGQGALLVERIEGDFFNVMGLPVLPLAQALREYGIDLLA